MTKTFFNITMLSVFAYVSIFYSCLHNSTNKDKLINSYKCISVFQFVAEEDNQVVTLNGELIVTHFNGWKVYKTLRPQFNYSPIINGKSDTLNEELLSGYKNYTIFLLKDGDSLGFEWDSIFIKNINTVNFSAFKKRHEILNFSNFYNAKTDSFAAAYNSKDTLLEIYVPRVKIDRSYPDSSYYSFWNKKKNETDFSFSKELESKHNKWLYRVEMIYDSIPPTAEFEKGVPRHIFKYSIKDTLVSKREMLKFIEKGEMLKKSIGK